MNVATKPRHISLKAATALQLTLSAHQRFDLSTGLCSPGLIVHSLNTHLPSFIFPLPFKVPGLPKPNTFLGSHHNSHKISTLSRTHLVWTLTIFFELLHTKNPVIKPHTYIFLTLLSYRYSQSQYSTVLSYFNTLIGLCPALAISGHSVY